MDVTLEVSAPLPTGDVLEGVETLISGTTLHIREVAGIWHENQPDCVTRMHAVKFAMLLLVVQLVACTRVSPALGE